jgi:glycosyltransferase involved in cell wall biosynthesis
MSMVDSNSGNRSSPPRLLIVSFEQFGYHTDSSEYCRHLEDRFRITYLCPDQGLPRKSLADVEVIYRERPPFGRVELGLLLEAHRLLQQRRYEVAFLRRTKFSFLLRLLHTRTPMVLDIRSGSIEESRPRRMMENTLLRMNAAFFPNITVISNGLARQLGLPRTAHVLPLGANPQPLAAAPSGNELRLVYVGTFKNRHLERTVEGLGEFLREAADDLSVRYTLVGFGREGERQAIQAAVATSGLGDRVQIRDRIDREAVPALLAEHNVGVAFTPQVPCFEHQPSTKVFEYLQSGLLCIATDNQANREVISSVNGVLVPDSVDGFRRGLERVVAKLPHWRPQEVADSIRGHTWRAIVEENLVPYLERITHR